MLRSIPSINAIRVSFDPPGELPTPKSIRPGKSASSSLKFSATFNGVYCDSKTPPEPTRIDFVCEAICEINTSGDTLARPFVMATKGEISEQRPEVQEVFNFLSSEEGKTLIEKVGLINVK